MKHGFGALKILSEFPTKNVYNIDHWSQSSKTIISEINR